MLEGGYLSGQVAADFHRTDAEAVLGPACTSYRPRRGSKTTDVAGVALTACAMRPGSRSTLYRCLDIVTHDGDAAAAAQGAGRLFAVRSRGRFQGVSLLRCLPPSARARRLRWNHGPTRITSANEKKPVPASTPHHSPARAALTKPTALPGPTSAV